jgi:hypothetical protein
VSVGEHLRPLQNSIPGQFRENFAGFGCIARHTDVSRRRLDFVMLMEFELLLKSRRSPSGNRASVHRPGRERPGPASKWRPEPYLGADRPALGQRQPKPPEGDPNGFNSLRNRAPVLGQRLLIYLLTVLYRSVTMRPAISGPRDSYVFGFPAILAYRTMRFGS